MTTNRFQRHTVRGFTLLELIVAISIFTLLGLMLVTTLRTAIGAWQRGEQVRGLFESARLVSRQIQRDLEAVFPQKNALEERDDIRFWSDFDANDRQRLMFVRTLGADERNWMTWAAGSGTVTGEGHAEFYNKHRDSEKKLRPHGGLTEVAYVMDPDPDSFTLWRGVRSPVGMPGTLIDPASTDSAAKVAGACHAISRDVLYLRWYFWSPRTTSWADGGQWEAVWDSTRGILDTFAFHVRGGGSRTNYGDDLWPFKVRVEMTLRGEGDSGLFAWLRERVGPTDRVIKVSSTQGFPDPEEEEQAYVRIGNEWISYSSKDLDAFHVRKRGARGTKAALHEPSSARSVTYYDPEDTQKKKPMKKTVDVRAKVLAGRTFSLVCDLPSVGEFGR